MIFITISNYLEKIGVAEIKITYVHLEGTKKGIDIDYSKRIKKNTSLPCIFEGGIGNLRHLEDYFLSGLESIALGTILNFSDNNIRTNVTLVFSAGQALLAAKAGASYVSPFIGRLDDISTDGLGLISEIREIYDNYGFSTEILAASIRHTMHIIDCSKIGADVITAPLKSILGLLNHPLTDIGLENFLKDYRKGN